MKEIYYADKDRYSNGMEYERCGRSGVLLPKVSLGFWHNFGSVDPYERSREKLTMLLITVSTISIWPTTMDLFTALLRRRWDD